jgi:hypothetical protein
MCERYMKRALGGACEGFYRAKGFTADAPLPPRSCSTPSRHATPQLATYLQATRDSFRESRFGALLWTSLPTSPTLQHPDNYDPDIAADTPGLSFRTKKFVEYVAMVNFTSAHALPSYVSLANEAIVRTINPAVTIVTRNFPLPLSQVEVSLESADALEGAILCMLFALPFIPATFASTVIAERVSKSKHIQLTSGVTSLTYWSATLLFDYASFLVSGVLIIILLVANNIDELTDSDSIGMTVGLLLAWGASIACFSYTISFFFQSTLTSFGFTILTNFVFGYLAGLAGLISFLLKLTMGADDTDDVTCE